MKKIWLAVGCILILAGVPLMAVAATDGKKSILASHWVTLGGCSIGIDSIFLSPHSLHYFQHYTGLGDRLIDRFIYRACEHVLIDRSIESALIIHCEVDAWYLWVTAVDSEELVTIHNFTLGNAGAYFIGLDGERHLDIEIKTLVFHRDVDITYPYATFGVIGILFVILGGAIVCVYLDRSRRTRTDKPSLQT